MLCAVFPWQGSLIYLSNAEFSWLIGDVTLDILWPLSNCCPRLRWGYNNDIYFQFRTSRYREHSSTYSSNAYVYRRYLFNFLLNPHTNTHTHVHVHTNSYFHSTSVDFLSRAYLPLAPIHFSSHLLFWWFEQDRTCLETTHKLSNNLCNECFSYT